MSTTATITITARDQASQAFQAIGKSAGGMSSSVQQSAKGFDVLKGAMAGLASSAVIGFLGDSARAAAEAEVSMQRLETAVGNTGKSFADLEPSINAALDGAEQLAFDGEDAADALATLTSFTGDASEALDLLGLTMDIARGRGVDLATAASAVGKAAEGNVGALTRMGVAIEDGATASEALAQAQATFAGQAEAYAGTAAGAADRITVAWGNLREEIGGLAGPLTGIISLLPGLSAGFSGLSTAIGALKGAVGLGGVTAAAGPAAGALGGLTAAAAALAPVMLALAPLVATVGVVMVQAADDAQRFTDQVNIQKAALDEWGLAAGVNGQELLDFVRNYRGLTEVQEFDYQGNITGTVSLGDAFGYLTGMSADQIAAIASQIDFSKDLTEQEDILAKAIGEQITISKMRTVAMLDTADASRVVIGLESVLGSEVEKTGRALNASMVNYGNLKSGIVGTAAEYGRYVDAANAAYDAEYGVMSAEERAIKVREEVRTGIVGTASEFERYVTSANNAAAAADAEAEAARQMAAAFQQTLTPAIQGVAGALTKLVVPGEDILDVLSRLGDTAPNIANGFADLVDGLNDSAGALDGVLGIFKQVDQLGGRAQDAEDIAAGLVGDPGVYATVDDLLAKGLITRGQYAQLQADEVRISEANAAIQEDLNVIRMGQIGNLADATDGYAAYIDKLSQASDEEQLHALYLMDTANQAKVAAAYSTAYEASLGNIPKDVATDIIANGAMADPVLAGILEDYGLIEMGADGTITVTFPDASEQAVNRFEAMFGEGNVAMTANGLVVVTDDAGNQMVYDQFGNLVDKSVTATVNIDLNDTTGLFERGGGGVVANDVLAQALPETQMSFAVIIESDITEFEDGLADATDQAESFAESSFVAELAADASAWEETLGTATDEGNTWVDTTFTTNVDGDPTAWNDVLAAAMTEGGNWENEVFVTNLDGNRDFFDAVVAEVDGKTMGTAYIELDGVDSNGDLAGTGGGGGGNQLGGTVRSQDVSSVAKVYQTAANGRTVLVGEAGPELAFLPYGTQVMPSTPSRSRMAADGNGGMRFYGPVHIHAASPDIAREIERQMTTRAMR